MLSTRIASSVDIISVIFSFSVKEEMFSVIQIFSSFFPFFFFFLFFFFVWDSLLLAPVAFSSLISSLLLQGNDFPFLLVTRVQLSSVSSFGSLVRVKTSPCSFDIGNWSSSSPCIFLWCCIRSASISIAMVSSEVLLTSSVLTLSSSGIVRRFSVTLTCASLGEFTGDWFIVKVWPCSTDNHLCSVHLSEVSFCTPSFKTTSFVLGPPSGNRSSPVEESLVTHVGWILSRP